MFFSNSLVLINLQFGTNFGFCSVSFVRLSWTFRVRISSFGSSDSLNRYEFKKSRKFIDMNLTNIRSLRFLNYQIFERRKNVRYKNLISLYGWHSK